MRTALTLGCLLASLGCSSKSSGPSLAPDQRAGEVLSVAGSARAVNPIADAPRPLTVGAELLAGDTIETEPGASVRIKLDHNGAVLAIEGDKAVALATSPAWTASSRRAGALDHAEDEATQVAGRHGEQSAGDTRATVHQLTPKRDPAGARELDAPAERPEVATPPTITGGDEAGGEAALRKGDVGADQVAFKLTAAHRRALQRGIDSCAALRLGPKRAAPVSVVVKRGRVTSIVLPEPLPDAYRTCIEKAVRKMTLPGAYGTHAQTLKL